MFNRKRKLCSQLFKLSLGCLPHINLQTFVFHFYTKIVLSHLLMPQEEMGYSEMECCHIMIVANYIFPDFKPQFASVSNEWVINRLHNTSDGDE